MRLIIKNRRFVKPAPKEPEKSDMREIPARIEFANIMTFNEYPVPIKTNRRIIFTTAHKNWNPPITGSSGSDDTIKIPITICTIIATINAIIVTFANASNPKALSNQYRIKFIKILPCFVYSKTSCT